MANSSAVSLLGPLKSSTSRQESGSTSASSDLAVKRLREVLMDAKEKGAPSAKFELEFVETLLKSVEGTREAYSGLKGDIDHMKRTSHQYLTGFTVAQEEYQKEVAARKDLQAEVSRLQVQLSGQAARLTAMSAETRTQSMLERVVMDLNNQVATIAQEVAKIRVERDMGLAELDEIAATRKNGHITTSEVTANLARAMSSRLDYVKSQYRKDLEALQEKREWVLKEITELGEARDIFLEETTALNTRNEQLADLNAQIAAQIQNVVGDPVASTAAGQHVSQDYSVTLVGSDIASTKASSRGRKNARSRYSPSVTSFNTVGTNSTYDISEETVVSFRGAKPSTPEPHVHQKKFRWLRDAAGGVMSNKAPHAPLGVKGHNFASANMLRITRCDHCGDKLWGAQMKCTNCSFCCHPRCSALVKGMCKQLNGHSDELAEIIPFPPSMFGRNLVEQARADAQGDDRLVPIIVDKCIAAVEFKGMDYEGIYRKNGGSSQSKAITQLFERGRYESFDLLDNDTFNDVSSITSVLKNYLRSLPNPLFTAELHEAFIKATTMKTSSEKFAQLSQLVRQLPKEHFATLKVLMLHLNRVKQQSNINLMNARNLGVVFGPTLMRSSDPSQEFADMAGKALTIEWFIENATSVFAEQATSS
ncbi:Rho GTPase activation protein [Cantharellus anzutake]|uniref:Rho GTPase activation protein n=1 Tax=Cantharellus anzutake TaxID=1750568 RepID=UPI0019062035|nr:Rho GTPase activation protein [Cantharellus anzutake]KAF8342190.1 Rho GTPase activation protein [Cantharellus anzutake]